MGRQATLTTGPRPTSSPYRSPSFCSRFSWALRLSSDSRDRGSWREDAFQQFGPSDETGDLSVDLGRSGDGYFVYPESFDDVYIGTTYPAAFFGLISSVTLTTNETVRQLFLGNGTNAFGTLTIQSGGQLVVTNGLYMGTQTVNSAGAVNRTGGTLHAGFTFMNNSSTLNLLPGDSINRIQFATGSPTVSLVQPTGAQTGVTLFPSAPFAPLLFDAANGRLQLTVDGGASSGLDWVLRASNPSGGSWVSHFNDLIDSGNIVVSGGNDSVFSHADGFTYIAVPEPGTMLSLPVGLAVLGMVRRRRRS